MYVRSKCKLLISLIILNLLWFASWSFITEQRNSTCLRIFQKCMETIEFEPINQSLKWNSTFFLEYFKILMRPGLIIGFWFIIKKYIIKCLGLKICIIVHYVQSYDLNCKWCFSQVMDHTCSKSRFSEWICAKWQPLGWNSNNANDDRDF